MVAATKNALIVNKKYKIVGGLSVEAKKSLFKTLF
jgi:hypothetical protein